MYFSNYAHGVLTNPFSEMKMKKFCAQKCTIALSNPRASELGKKKKSKKKHFAQKRFVLIGMPKLDIELFQKKYLEKHLSGKRRVMVIKIYTCNPLSRRLH